MPVTDVRKDPHTLTLTMTSEFDASVEQVWQLWADPRKLERWWGPPTYPAKVEHHDLSPGGKVTYMMTGPEGDQHRGWWTVVAVEPPTSLEFVDGFADADGAPNTELPTTSAVVSIRALGPRRTQMQVISTFGSLEQMEQLIAMGMLEGITAAANQIDAILAIQP
jgi:uncharacterized protein YndB with AHSA1/START domain